MRYILCASWESPNPTTSVNLNLLPYPPGFYDWEWPVTSFRTKGANPLAAVPQTGREFQLLLPWYGMVPGSPWGQRMPPCHLGPWFPWCKIKQTRQVTGGEHADQILFLPLSYWLLRGLPFQIAFQKWHLLNDLLKHVPLMKVIGGHWGSSSCMIPCFASSSSLPCFSFFSLSLPWTCISQVKHDYFILASGFIF